MPVDARNILMIPLSEHLQEDFAAWHKTKSFVFSVRSAYYIEWEHQFGARTRREDGQGASNPNLVWDILWKLSVPSKINIFVWKAPYGTVPGKAILAARHIPVVPICPICKGGPEDIRHLRFTCNNAREVWHALGLEEVIDNALVVDRSGSVIPEYIVCHPTRRSPILGGLGLQESIVVACWHIWWQRREMVRGKLVAAPLEPLFQLKL